MIRMRVLLRILALLFISNLPTLVTAKNKKEKNEDIGNNAVDEEKFWHEIPDDKTMIDYCMAMRMADRSLAVQPWWIRKSYPKKCQTLKCFMRGGRCMIGRIKSHRLFHYCDDAKPYCRNRRICRKWWCTCCIWCSRVPHTPSCRRQGGRCRRNCLKDEYLIYKGFKNKRCSCCAPKCHDQKKCCALGGYCSRDKISCYGIINENLCSSSDNGCFCCLPEQIISTSSPASTPTSTTTLIITSSPASTPTSTTTLIITSTSTSTPTSTSTSTSTSTPTSTATSTSAPTSMPASTMEYSTNTSITLSNPSISTTRSPETCPDVSCIESDLTEGRIINGDDSKIAKHPWMVSLRTGTFDGPHFCGGSIINSCWILTAAHCFNESTNSIHPSWWKRTNLMIFVAFGLTNQKNAPKGNTVKASKLPIDAGFNYNTGENDIALLKLDKAILMGGAIKIPRAICLPKGEMELDEGNVMATGWGHTDLVETVPDQLQEVILNLITINECKKKYAKEKTPPPTFNKGIICTFTNKKTIWRGDSGGPLVQIGKDKKIKPFIIGVVSYQWKSTLPSAYTKVIKHKPWIEKTMGKK